MALTKHLTTRVMPLHGADDKRDVIVKVAASDLFCGTVCTKVGQLASSVERIIFRHIRQIKGAVLMETKF